MTIDHKSVFETVESTLIRVGKQNGVGDIEQQLDAFKTVARHNFRDADYYRKLVHITFYSGFRAATVDAKLSVIDECFPDYKTVASYGPQDLSRIMSDDRMIRHEKKLKGCIDNARAFRDTVDEYGSFQLYLDSFAPQLSFKNLMALRRDLTKFAYLSKITSLHFLMDIGFPVLKPDRVVMRIFHRLGFLKDETVTEHQILSAVEVGHQFVHATGHPIRYVDIVFVAYGQVSSNASMQQGICLKDNPRCGICDAAPFCNYANSKQT